MEQFLSSFGQHATSFFNLKAMAWVNTGDRMLDTTIQMMVSTITAALVGGLLALYKNRGLVTDIKQWIRCTFAKGDYNPLDFDASLTDRKPLNGKEFMFCLTLNMDMRKAFGFWFLEHHSNKLFRIEGQEKGITIIGYEGKLPTLLSKKELVDSHIYKYRIVPFDFSCKNADRVPIWKDQSGHWVYFATDNHSFELHGNIHSDSLNAIENCFKSIKDYHDQLVKVEEEAGGKAPDQQYILEMNGKDGSSWQSTGKIPINKTFDTLFFEQKDTVLPVLQGFKDKTLFPAHLPVDNKLGILLHGPPGTGKTGFISALANFLGRKIILMDMSKITTRSVLDKVLGNNPAKDCIFVFEEFDTMPGIQKRKKEVDVTELVSSSGMKSPEMMMMAMASTKDTAMMDEYKKEMEAAKDKIDLGYLLRKLDGLESANERIIVATTNHPEKIDPALLRPGRFGIQIRLGNATKQMIRGIVGMIYQETVSEEDVEGIKEGKWSPAEILQCGLLFTKKEKLLEHLRTASPSV